MIVSTFHACFDILGNVHPESRDRAYYSGRAILWIHTLATCKSGEFANRFPFPLLYYTAAASDHDLAHLLNISMYRFANLRFVPLFDIHPGHTPSHSQCISNVLLHYSWANRTILDYNLVQEVYRRGGKTSIPLDAMLNRILAWCICLGSPVEEEVLKVQDKP